MTRVLGPLLLVAVIGSVLLVGGLLTDVVSDHQVEQAAINQAEAACNAELPGANWSVENRSLDLDQLGESQTLLCERGNHSREIDVTIQIEFKGEI